MLLVCCCGQRRRSAVEEKANTVKSNHKQIVDFINSEINNCGQGDENLKTAWGIHVMVSGCP